MLQPGKGAWGLVGGWLGVGGLGIGGLGTAPLWVAKFTSKDSALQGGGDRGAQAIVRGGAPRCASQVLHRCAQAVSRGAARCASQVLDRVAHADARGATHVLDRADRSLPAAPLVVR